MWLKWLLKTKRYKLLIVKMQLIEMSAIFDNRKWIYLRSPPCLKLTILLQTMFVPSFMLVPSHRTILEQSQIAIYSKNIYANFSFYSDFDSSNSVTLKQIHRR